MVCLPPKRNRSTCDIYTKTKGCLLIKSSDAFLNTVKQLLVNIWKDILITVCLSTTLTTQVDQRNLQKVMKKIYVQRTTWEFPLGLSPQKDLELRLVFLPQLLCGLHAEYLIDMTIGIYNHAERHLDTQRRLQEIKVCSTNETFVTFLLETLRQFLLWSDVICAQDKSLWRSPSSEITRTKNK